MEAWAKCGRFGWRFSLFSVILTSQLQLERRFSFDPVLEHSILTQDSRQFVRARLNDRWALFWKWKSLQTFEWSTRGFFPSHSKFRYAQRRVSEVPRTRALRPGSPRHTAQGAQIRVQSLRVAYPTWQSLWRGRAPYLHFFRQGVAMWCFSKLC